MSTEFNTHPKLSKLYTSPKRGHKLGSARATWSKIKCATKAYSNDPPISNDPGNNPGVSANGSLSLPSSNSPSPTGLSPQLSENEDETVSPIRTDKAAPDNLVVAFGENSDLYIYFSHWHKLEVWRWTDDEALSFVTQVDLSNTISKGNKITRMLVIKPFSQLLLVTPTVGHIYDFDAEGGSVVKSCPLPENPDLLTNCSLIGNYLILDANGKLIIYKFDAKKTEYTPLNIPNIQSQAGINIEKPYTLQTSSYKGVGVFAVHQNWLVYSPTKEEYKVLKSTASKHKKALKRQEKLNYKNKKVNNDFSNGYLNGSSTSLLSGQNNEANSSVPLSQSESSKSGTSVSSFEAIDDSALFTPVKLPPPGPLLNKVLNSVSNQALDGLFKLGEAGSKQLKLYLQQQQQLLHPQPQESVSINDLGKSFGKMLYSTAKSTAKEITKQTKHVTSQATSAVQYQLSQNHTNGNGNANGSSGGIGNEDGLTGTQGNSNGENVLNPSTPVALNQLVKIVDLENDKVLGLFRAPGGDLAHVSLSPYDMHLLTVGARGDTFYLWDLYQLPLEISLVGKFHRGKTSAKIADIVWLNQIKGNQGGHSNGYSKTAGSRVGTQSNQSLSNGSRSNDDVDDRGSNNEGGGISLATYGFGCISKAHGLVHWFDLNYLSLNLQKKPPTDSNNWILSSINAKQFAKVPQVTGAPFSSNDATTSNSIEELAILNDAFDLILVSPTSGTSLYKFQLPRSPLSPDLVGSARAEALKQNYSTSDQQFPVTDTFGDSDGDADSYDNSNDHHGNDSGSDNQYSVEDGGKPRIKSFFDHLSQVEIDSCVPYTHAINNPRLSLQSYKVTDSENTDSLVDQFYGLIDRYYGEDFGNEIDSTSVPVFGVSKVW